MQTRFVLVAFLILILLPVAGAETLDYELTIEVEQLALIETTNGITIRLPSYPASGSPGQVALPSRLVRLALPPKADLESLSYTIIDLTTPVELALGNRQIRRVRPLVKLCPNGPTDCDRDLVPARPPDRMDPGRTIYKLAGGKLQDVVIAEFIHRPITLHEGNNRLQLHSRQLLRLTFELLPNSNKDSAKRVPHRPKLASDLVDNLSQLDAFYPRPRGPDPDWPGLAVITTNDFVTGSQELSGFLSAHQERGFDVHLVTETEFEMVQGPPPNGRAQKIRTWLQQNWENLALGYVVLVGNPDPLVGDLPMLNAYPYPPGEEGATPTDAYYADMSGDWDPDQDQRFGEYYDDSGPGGVDFFPELVVGRIPAYNIDVADRLLSRAVRYARTRRASNWRKRVLLPSAILFFEEDFPYNVEEGAPVLEYVKAEFVASGFDTTTMYETEGEAPSNYPSDLALSEDGLIAEWNSGYGIVYWIGHGDETAAYRMIGDRHYWDNVPFMRSDVYDLLPHETPAFVFHGSCSNGTPEFSNNIGAIQLESGAIASFASTRVGLSGGVEHDWQPDENNCGIFSIGYNVVSKLRDGKSAGSAISETRAMLSDVWWAEYGWHSKFATTLYGDPTLSLYFCESDQDCAGGETCFGEESCQQGFCEPVNGPADCSHLDEACKVGRCNELTKECEAVALDDVACDDGHWCSLEDTCLAGECIGSERDCSDDDPCTLDSCDFQSDECKHDPESGAACHDGLYCTADDVCQAGLCVGSTSICPQATGQCLVAVCDEEANQCGIEHAQDGLACSLDEQEGVCRAGACETEQAGGCSGCASSRPTPGGGLAFCLLLFLLYRRHD
jgi:peptidase C25-like protein